eukprot:6400320-Ditylum_brightwellii.AAC.1
MVKTETRLQTKLSKAPAVKSKAPLMAPGKNESLKGNVRGNGLVTLASVDHLQDPHNFISSQLLQASEHTIKDRAVKDQPR